MLKMRMQILLDGLVIDENVFSFCNEVIDILSNEGFNQDSCETFITHLAMASMRIKNGNIVDCNATEMINEVREQAGEEIFATAELLWNKIKKFSKVEFPEAEVAFVFLHLCNIFINA